MVMKVIKAMKVMKMMKIMRETKLWGVKEVVEDFGDHDSRLHELAILTRRR